ncbi:hypothetical protein BD413DRAFT_642914 [Trametes elegans]|nr:hypothetical protein BD413DRAFT_642914 [Trametes elegans]
MGAAAAIGRTRSLGKPVPRALVGHPDPRRVQHTAPAGTRSPKKLQTLDVPDDPCFRPHSSRTGSSSPERVPSDAAHTPLSPKEDPYVHAQLQKRRIARRTKWAVVLVPLVLVLIGLSTRYITHPAAFDVLRPRSDWRSVASSVADWRPHKRHVERAEAETATTNSATATGSSLSLAPSATAAPTEVDSSNTHVPASPPALPTPFPQAFDSSVSTNFTTVGCQTFFTNMTVSPAFRTCRPFSLLVSDSNAFITSQRNISLLNAIIWGTCNTEPSAEECAANMGWFAANIKTQCRQDIAAQNPIVLDAVAGLEGFSALREAACDVDAETNTYCYVEAAQSTHPSDLYLYELPLGLGLPNTTVPSCTGCVQSLMKTFVTAGANLTALQKTYPAAAAIVNGACGGQFVAELDGTPNAARAALAQGGAFVAGAAVLLGALLTL